MIGKHMFINTWWSYERIKYLIQVASAMAKVIELETFTLQLKTNSNNATMFFVFVWYDRRGS